MQKPVELYTIPIRNHTKKGEIVADPFCGSGSSLIACEQTGRVCRAMEIDPGYTAVILQRYLDSTGTQPVLIEGDK